MQTITLPTIVLARWLVKILICLQIMNDLVFLILSLALTLSGIILIFFAPSTVKSGILVGLVIVTSILTSIPAIHALLGVPFEAIFHSRAFGVIPIHIDGLSAWFILIINLTCINGALYGREYMKNYSEQKNNLSLHWILFLLFQSSMLWVCMVQNSIVFLILWEIMSLSSMMLVIFDYQKKNTLKAGLNYLVQMHIGVVFLTIAFVWVYFTQGSFEFSAIGAFFSNQTNIWLFLLFFVGFGIKAGFIPLHSWLPHAHPAAPSHVSGVMSGVIVKLGIYGIFRIITFLKMDYLILGESILLLSILTGIYGILNAAVQFDFKKMLAYCTIENIGIIGAGLGLGLIGMGNQNQVLILLGFGGALLHILNHSLFKSLLFFSAGSVYQQTHTRNIEKLGGLIKKMPATALLFLVGSLAIGGLPPFNGFISEFLIFSGFLEGIKILGNAQTTLMIFSLAGLAIIGGVSLLTFTKNFGMIFLGNPRSTLQQEPKETSLAMRFPQYLIIAIMLSIGIFPEFYYSSVLNILKSNAFFQVENVNVLPQIQLVSWVGKFSFLFLILLSVVVFLRYYFVRSRKAVENTTWGCGYVGVAEKAQYTGKSYSKTLAKLLNFILRENKKYQEISTHEIFPEKRQYASGYMDLVESTVIDKGIKRLLNFLNLFQFIQNGKIQSYLIYGIVFIVLVFLGTLFNLI